MEVLAKMAVFMAVLFIAVALVFLALMCAFIITKNITKRDLLLDVSEYVMATLLVVCGILLILLLAMVTVEFCNEFVVFTT